MSEAKKIKIKHIKTGKELEVFEKAFKVVYSKLDYKPADDPIFVEKENDDDVDIATLSKEELKNVTNNKLRDYLDELDIEYSSRANKDELIALIVGEENGSSGSEGDNPGQDGQA